MHRVFGLIGKKLSHSFSKDYFTSKFEKEEIRDCEYNLYELAEISELKDLIKANLYITGLNVTVPYKTEVIPLLNDLDDSARKVGAVNVISFQQDRLIGYNSDYYGFQQSLINWLGKDKIQSLKSLVLGTGGASKAVCAVLDDLGISKKMVTRNSVGNTLDYDSLNEQIIKEFQLIVNTTPLGMFPEVVSKPQLQYRLLTGDHFLYDLVYNPELTSFMRFGQENGAQVKNGLEMLYLQAEKSWEIWNS